jgi:hypothetical protein
MDLSQDHLALEVTPGSVRLVARGAVAWALAGAAVGAMAALLAWTRADESRDRRRGEASRGGPASPA